MNKKLKPLITVVHSDKVSTRFTVGALKVDKIQEKCQTLSSRDNILNEGISSSNKAYQYFTVYIDHTIFWQ